MKQYYIDGKKATKEEAKKQIRLNAKTAKKDIAEWDKIKFVIAISQ